MNAPLVSVVVPVFNGMSFLPKTVDSVLGQDVPLQDLGNRFSAAVVRKLVDEGFCAVHVDRRGFTDTAWTWVNAGLRESFGAPVVSGDDGTWLAYALPGAGQ